MGYDFDKIIDRYNTDSLKFDFAAPRGKPEGLLPMWVADMDFQAPPCVIDALVDKSRHGVFGYSETKSDYFAVLRDWFSARFNWRVEEEWLVKTPGVVVSLAAAVQGLTKPGDAVIILQPVYYPFSAVINDTDRRLVASELRLVNGRYEIDFADFEDKLARENVKLFLLCNPHNPGGRVWTRDELVRLGDICVKHGVIVVSDEIHEDFVYPGHRHTVFADIKPEFNDITVTCTSPTKSFNLAGLHIGNTFIANPDLRARFERAYAGFGLSQVSVMGIVACRAAYTGGGEWLDALVEYLTGNLAYLRDFLKQELPRVKLIEPDGTYLIWLDFRDFGITDAELEEFIVRDAGLWLDGGTMFGASGAGFQRINIACPRATLELALDKLKAATKARFGG
jgi:cystathionine beta-lyase